jgi:hypothetical protein
VAASAALACDPLAAGSGHCHLSTGGAGGLGMPFHDTMPLHQMLLAPRLTGGGAGLLMCDHVAGGTGGGASVPLLPDWLLSSQPLPMSWVGDMPRGLSVAGATAGGGLSTAGGPPQPLGAVIGASPSDAQAADAAAHPTPRENPNAAPAPRHADAMAGPNLGMLTSVVVPGALPQMRGGGDQGGSDQGQDQGCAEGRLTAGRGGMPVPTANSLARISPVAGSGMSGGGASLPALPLLSIDPLTGVR